ncbi:MAG: hypothetical protein L3J53_04580 [Proteobacteria bacterium]|nr:hypothetical protein [Pseudomonadota bacterium]
MLYYFIKISILSLVLSFITTVKAQNKDYIEYPATYQKYQMVRVELIDAQTETITYKVIDTGNKVTSRFLRDDDGYSCEIDPNKKYHKNASHASQLGFYCLSVKPLIDSQEYKLSGKKYQILIGYKNKNDYMTDKNGLVVGIAQDMIEH